MKSACSNHNSDVFLTFLLLFLLVLHFIFPVPELSLRMHEWLSVFLIFVFLKLHSKASITCSYTHVYYINDSQLTGNDKMLLHR